MSHFWRPIFALSFAAFMVASGFRRMLLPLRAREAPTLMACGVWLS
jgi:hypothetical protein